MDLLDLLKISDLNESESVLKIENSKQVNSHSVSPSSSVGELLFGRLDKDKNGVIDKEEFLAVVGNAQGVNALAIALGNKSCEIYEDNKIYYNQSGEK